MSNTFKDEAPKYQKAPRWNDWWPWYKSEPKWWRKLFKHKARRAELKRAMLTDDHDGQVYPLDKKPWRNFW
jgi:hypothetical protein